jgi:dihydroorotate dehydrogenase (fumarate)
MLKTSVGGIELESCIYNASGPRTGSIEALQKIGERNTGAILSKSATLVKQDGNPLPRFVNKIDLGSSKQGSINSEGLPNAGIDYYISSEAIETLSQFRKPYIVSLSGLCLDDNMEMLTRVFQTEGVAAIEVHQAFFICKRKHITNYLLLKAKLSMSKYSWKTNHRL